MSPVRRSSLCPKEVPLDAMIQSIPVGHIRPGNNDRKRFDRAALEELAASIRAHGLAQPITVRILDRGLYLYEVVAGERRLRAVRDVLGWPAIPCVVRDMDAETAASIMLAENTARADLDPIEEAGAYQSRIERFGWTVARVAEVAGVSEELVKRRLSLLKLVPEAQTLVADSHLGLGHAEAMSALDANRQRIALRILGEGRGVSLAQFRVIVNELVAEQSQDALFGLEQFWVEQVQQAPVIRSGKRADPGAPIRADLPPVQINLRTTGEVFEKYIADLAAAGKAAEAGTVGRLYTALVHGNFVAIPTTRFI